MANVSPPPAVDAAEIAKFSALAASWWDPKGPFAALHRMNPVRLGFVRARVLAHFGGFDGRRALDLGCGGGLVTLPLARMGADVLGLDASAEAVGAARAHAAAAGIEVRFQEGTAEALAGEAPGRFDLITALEIVEHVPDLAGFLVAAETLLAPGGLLIVSTINRTQRARTFALFAAEKLLNMAPDGAHDYEKLVRPEELEAAAPKLAWEEPVGLMFDPLNRAWRLGADVSINYVRAAVKPR